MTFSEYLALPGAKSLQEVADESGVSYQTIKGVARGMKVAKYDVAKAISEVTQVKGKKKHEICVSIAELCE